MQTDATSRGMSVGLCRTTRYIHEVFSVRTLVAVFAGLASPRLLHALLQGLKAISVLSKDGIKCNCTLIFSANQALLAAKAGAYIVSPFVGRLGEQQPAAFQAENG